MPKVTIITVCLNAEKVIEETIESVLKLDFKDYEYLIIDGKSTDGTMEIAGKFSMAFQEKGVSYKIISESDSGIYDAMNKGIQYAAGDWIIYMNAGDTFYDEEVLKNISGEFCREADVIYGNVILKDRGHYKKAELKPIDEINKRMPIVHQGVFAQRKVIQTYMFNTEYPIAADYDLLVRLYLAGKKFIFVDKNVAIYGLDGVSEKHPIKTRKEQILVRKNAGMKETQCVGWLYVYTFVYYAIRNILKKLAPPILYSARRGWMPDPNFDEPVV